VKVLGAALPRAWQSGAPGDGTIVALGDAGDVQAVRRTRSIAQSAEAILELAAAEPFLAGVDLPVVVPEKESRVRPVENLVRRRLGVRLPPGGRAALVPGRGGVAGEALLAALSAAGHPCLPYPDRDRLRSGLAEIHAPLVLKALLWEGSPLARASAPVDREDVLREYAAPDYATGSGRSRASWIERLATIDVALRALGPVDGFDSRAVREAMAAAGSAEDLDRAASLLDASLIASAARRYLDEPETCVFLGDRQSGYTILPADALVRRVALKESAPGRSHLFPRASLRERLGGAAELKPLDLLPVPGRPERLEAVFHEPPLREFDNLDEMLWWKHCRHLSGPDLPVEGLQEMVVLLDPQAQALHETPLRLVRSRHRTLSFRFEPPRVWRARVPTRDGRTYSFRVLRAVYETRAAAGR
jgi:predicted RNase H-like nuclease